MAAIMRTLLRRTKREDEGGGVDGARFANGSAALRGTLRPRRADRELEEELRAAPGTGRRGRRAARPIAGGRAGRAAGLDAGGVAQAMEALRDQRGLPWLEDLARDLRYGCRMLARNPGFTVVVGPLARDRHRRQQRRLQLRRHAAASAAHGAPPGRGADGRLEPTPFEDSLVALVSRLRRHPRSQHELRRAGRRSPRHGRVRRRPDAPAETDDRACW